MPSQHNWTRCSVTTNDIDYNDELRLSTRQSQQLQTRCCVWFAWLAATSVNEEAKTQARLGYTASMPTILLIRGWRVVIYTNDHRPPHVHVIGATEHARYALLCDLKTVRLMDYINFSTKQLRTVEAQLVRNIALICKAWGEIHGH